MRLFKSSESLYGKLEDNINVTPTKIREGEILLVTKIFDDDDECKNSKYLGCRAYYPRKQIRLNVFLKPDEEIKSGQA